MPDTHRTARARQGPPPTRSGPRRVAPVLVFVLAVVAVAVLASCAASDVQTGNSAPTPPSSLTEPITVVVLGSSTASGVGAVNPAQAWVERFATSLEDVDQRNEVVNLAAPRLTTYQVLPTGSSPPPGRPAVDPARNITAALAAQPDAIVVNLPSNDAALAFSVDEQLANLDRIAAEATAAGIPIWVTTTQPRNLDAAGRALLASGRDRILERFGAFAIDVWTGLADPDGTIAPVYDSGDGTHLNADGHAVVAERVLAAGIVQAVTTP